MSSEVDTDDISVEYEVTRDSYEILKIKAYIPALNSWLDVSHMNEFESKAVQLVEKKLNEVI